MPCTKGVGLKFLTNYTPSQGNGYFCLMRWPIRIFDFYINSSIHVALAVVSLFMISTLILNISVENELICFVFFATISCYNVLKFGPRLYKWQKERPQRNAIAILSLLATFLTGFYAIALPRQVWPLLSLVLVLMAFYMLPVFPRDRNLRSLGIVKVLLVAACWTCITLLLPVISAHRELDWDIGILTTQRFLLIIALIIPFEIRDMHFDPPDIKTIPRRIGVKTTKILGVLLAILSLLLCFLRDEVSTAEIQGRLLMTLVLSLLIIRTPADPSKYYASFGVESLPILWLLITHWMYFAL